MASNYEPKAVITTIKATARASIKVYDNFYTMEYCEERVIPDVEGVNIEFEKQALWNTVLAEVDNQAEQTEQAVKRAMESKGRRN